MAENIAIENEILDNFLETDQDNIEKKKLQDLKDFYELLESMPRKQRRKMMKDSPRFSTVVNKYSKLKNLKNIIEKRN